MLSEVLSYFICFLNESITAYYIANEIICILDIYDLLAQFLIESCVQNKNLK